MLSGHGRNLALVAGASLVTLWTLKAAPAQAMPATMDYRFQFGRQVDYRSVPGRKIGPHARAGETLLSLLRG
jgi:hypothetical protein